MRCVHDELDDDRLGGGHVVGVVGFRHQNGEGFVAVLPGGGFRQAGAGDAEVKHLADGAAQDAGKPVLAAANIDGRHAALFIGR